MMEQRAKADVEEEEFDVGEKMQVDVLEKEGNRIKLHLKKTDRAQVNSIRRALIADVPKMAISKVRFEMGVTEDEETGEMYESVNTLSDEVIAHRLGLVPIPTFQGEFLFPEDDPQNEGLPEEQWGSPQSQIIYHCSARGPSRESDEKQITVRVGDMNVLGDTKLQIHDDYKSIPLTVLRTGQYLEFYAYATLGRGKTHSKWSAASGVSFYPREHGVLNSKKNAKLLFDMDLGITAKSFKNDKITEISDVEQLKKALNHVGPGTEDETLFANAITLNEVEGEFIFSYETDGSLDPLEAFNAACNELSNRFRRLEIELSDDLK